MKIIFLRKKVKKFFKKEFFTSANKIINDKVINNNILYMFYTESIKEENIVLLYEVFNQLLKISKLQDFKTINVNKK